MSYLCDHCGACCRHLIVEIAPVDVAREPKLVDAAKPFRAPLPSSVPYDDDHAEEYARVGPLVPGFEWGAMLAPSRFPDMACPLLGDDNLCTIYPTRPTCCVAMQAGSDQCRNARESAGLPPLPRSGEGSGS